MEHKQGSKKDNMNKVIEAVKCLSKTFVISDIQIYTNLNNNQCKRYLKGLCELKVIKYSPTTKIYMRC